MKKLHLWLNEPNMPLGNEKPINVLKKSSGKNQVMAELHRIMHGILS